MIGNYTELQAAVKKWLHRTDLDSLIPDFITLAEAKFNRKLRTDKMLVSITQALSGSTFTLPDDFLEAAVISLGRNKLEFIQRQEIDQAFGNFYTIQGNQIIFAEDTVSPADVTLRYYARIPALATNATNW